MNQITAKDLKMLIEAAASEAMRQGWPNGELTATIAKAQQVLAAIPIEVAA